MRHRWWVLGSFGWLVIAAPALGQDTGETGAPVTGDTADTAASGPLVTAASLVGDEGGAPWADACGCNGAPGPAAAWLALGLVAAGLRRQSRP